MTKTFEEDFQGRGYFEELVLTWLWEPKSDNESLDYYEERLYIIQAYLTGKALGVELVKVVRRKGPN